MSAKSPNKGNRRREAKPDPHQFAVELVPTLPPRLQVACTCGVVVGGKRYEDRTAVTVSDLMELVRLHYQTISER